MTSKDGGEVRVRLESFDLQLRTGPALSGVADLGN